MIESSCPGVLGWILKGHKENSGVMHMFINIIMVIVSWALSKLIKWYMHLHMYNFSSVAQSCPTLCDPWTAASQASLSITNSWSLLKLMSIASVMSSSVVPFSCLHFFPASGLFQGVTSSHQVAKVLEFQLQHQSFH